MHKKVKRLKSAFSKMQEDAHRSDNRYSIAAMTYLRANGSVFFETPIIFSEQGIDTLLYEANKKRVDFYIERGHMWGIQL